MVTSCTSDSHPPSRSPLTHPAPLLHGPSDMFTSIFFVLDLPYLAHRVTEALILSSPRSSLILYVSMCVCIYNSYVCTYSRQIRKALLWHGFVFNSVTGQDPTRAAAWAGYLSAHICQLRRKCWQELIGFPEPQGSALLFSANNPPQDSAIS